MGQNSKVKILWPTTERLLDYMILIFERLKTLIISQILGFIIWNRILWFLIIICNPDQFYYVKGASVEMRFLSAIPLYEGISLLPNDISWEPYSIIFFAHLFARKIVQKVRVSAFLSDGSHKAESHKTIFVIPV